METKLPQIKLSYSFDVPVSQRIVVTEPADVVPYMRAVWPDIEYRESMYAVYLNRANALLGYLQVAYGGLTEIIADVRIILQAALLSNSTGFILMHNHPTGNLNASIQDEQFTWNVKIAADTMRIRMIDHIIITAEGYMSFKEKGLL